MSPPRVALFADCFHEVNGAANSLRHLQAYAERHKLPLLSIHSGPATRRFTEGSITTLELKRSRASIGVDVDFGFDPLLWLQGGRISRELAAFNPDLIHIISPGDFSTVGAIFAHLLGIPVVGSFHTNLHQFAAARLQKTLRFLPAGLRNPFCRAVEKGFGRGLLKYYEIPRLSLAPTAEICEWLNRGTGRVCRVMGRGVDVELFNPSRRTRTDSEFHLGFVGRIMLEKNIRLLAEVERAIIRSGATNYRFVIVGHGDERAWLEENLQRVEFTGVLRGEDLARAYANMDLFVFPSLADTFGNVVLEALAAGTPALVMNQGGPRFLISSGVTGWVARDNHEFATLAAAAVNDPATAREMRTTARQSACSASWDHIFAGVWESYELCLQLPGRRRKVIAPRQAERVPDPEYKFPIPG